MKMNENGLTWERWLAAATLGLPNSRRHVFSDHPAYDVRLLHKAWKAGECPCDWAAELATSR